MARRSPLLLIFLTIFIDLVGFGIVIPILPLYAERFGASPLVIGCLLGAYSAMQCLCAPLLGKLSDRVGRRPVLLVSLVVAVALGARFFAVWLQKRRVMPDLIMVLGATVTVVAAGAALR